MSYQRLGTRVVIDNRGKTRAVPTNPPGSPVVVGFTRPDITYEKMRRTDVTARIMNDDVRVYVLRQEFKNAWNLWYARWREFFEKTMDEKFSNIFKSDAVAEQAEAYRQDLVRWQEAYSREKDSQGQALPSNAPPLPAPTPPNQPDGTNDKKESDGIPLWVFLAILAGVGVAVGGYFYVRKGMRVLKAKREAAEGMLPALFKMNPETAPFSEQLTKMATARDAFAKGAETSCDCARDLEMRVAPRAYAKYMLSGM